MDAESKGITELKKTYAALRESEQNYRTLVDQAALAGVLNILYERRVTILSVERVKKHGE